MNNYNPYELLRLLVNGQETYGRPYEFDSEVVDQLKMTNAAGEPVKPTKLVTSCPGCGAGLQFECVLPSPPFGILQYRCEHCDPGLPSFQNPFHNAVRTGRIAPDSLDCKTVLALPETPPSGPLVVASLAPNPPPKAKKKVKKRPSKITLEPQRTVDLPPAIDLNEEIDLEDLNLDDLVDDESNLR